MRLTLAPHLITTIEHAQCVSFGLQNPVIRQAFGSFWPTPYFVLEPFTSCLPSPSPGPALQDSPSECAWFPTCCLFHLQDFSPSGPNLVFIIYSWSKLLAHSFFSPRAVYLVFALVRLLASPFNTRHPTALGFRYTVFSSSRQ